MTKRWVAAAAVAVCLLPPGRGEAQANTCSLVGGNVGTYQAGAAFISVSGSFEVICTGGTTIRADSAAVYQASNEVHLFRNVNYRDPTRSLTSEYATYSSATGRLYATGNVVFTDVTRGSTLRGPELEYYRAMEGRPQAQVIAGQRPHLTVVPTGSGANREPLEIDGDRVTSVGENFFSASGNVVLRRSDLNATASEVVHDAQQQTLQLRGNARIRGERFDLSGETVDATLPANRLDRVVARRNAELVSEKLRVDGPEIHLFFNDDLLQRMVSRRDPAPGSDAERPLVTATGLRMEADSLEAILPQQQLERVVAIGGAVGETVDTTGQSRPSDPRARIARGERPAAGTTLVRDRDWVMGDTITGFFAPADTARAPARTAANRTTARDTTRSPEEEVELKRLVARGSARSFYRVQEEGKPASARPALNYLVGQEIEITLEDGEVDVAYVKGLQRGVYLDPDAPAASPPAVRGTGTEAAPGSGTPASRPAGTPAARQGTLPLPGTGQPPRRPQPAEKRP
ncbi:MAG TPA: OstA-like protein [Longimicrobiaceae bacterium]|nr:OstA-like protein [Longimicrobiaceae bacterium]